MNRTSSPTFPFTTMQRRTLEAYIAADDLTEAGLWLGVSESTVRRRLGAMRAAFDSENNRQLIAKATAAGMVSERAFR
ncbi:hypothetical protein [Salininema proteolyticum]|uniref:HTH luxR-type domain-containing protein n=1 Tax=Salininema proteolyticum TaxID=1607685 RepID=A0ABV8U509_9ACTN